MNFAKKFIEMKGVVILVKGDEMCNILKTVLASLAKQPYKRFFETSFKGTLYRFENFTICPAPCKKSTLKIWHI